MSPVLSPLWLVLAPFLGRLPRSYTPLPHFLGQSSILGPPRSTCQVKHARTEHKP
jgi:hypothetical protein